VDLLRVIERVIDISFPLSRDLGFYEIIMHWIHWRDLDRSFFSARYPVARDTTEMAVAVKGDWAIRGSGLQNIIIVIDFLSWYTFKIKALSLILDTWFEV